jgi:hypothetical protein
MNNFGISHNDTIRILCKDGSAPSRNIKAKVTPETVLTYETDIVVKEGDQVERLLSNGNMELYDIFGVHYTEQGRIKPPTYELKVAKTTAISRPVAANIVYILNGNNARVYNNSSDNSSNVVNVSPTDLFKELKNVISTKVPDNYILLVLAEAMEKESGTDKYLKSYVKFIEESATHLIELHPFIPGLSSLIKVI